MSGAQPLIGVAGKQYGLVIPKAPAPKAKAKGPGMLKAPAAVFGLGDDEEKTVEEQLLLEAERKKAARRNMETHSQALLEDPTVFDYDGVYDALSGDRADKQARADAVREQQRRKPKYINALMSRAAEKKIEDGIVMDRKIQKERAVDDHLYGDKEKFVTQAYKDKLKAEQAWKAQLDKHEAENKDASKHSDMMGFYANLLTNNVAMAGGPRNYSGRQPEAAENATPAVSAAKTSGNRSQSRSRSRSPPPNTAQPPAKLQRTEPHSPPPGPASPTTAAAPAASAASAAAKAPPPPPAQRKDSDALKAARERFLARKQQA